LSQITMDITKLENYLKEKIFTDLEKGRPNWDKPHTIAVVTWLKQILANTPNLNLDNTVLLIAAYAHDWGYSQIYSTDNLTNYGQVQNAKLIHMDLGANKVKTLLNKKFFGFLSESQKERVVHLVQVHDRLDRLSHPDELILMEADTLGALDVSLVKPTFDYQSNLKYIDEVRKNRISKFITNYSKKTVEKLIQARLDFYK